MGRSKGARRVLVTGTGDVQPNFPEPVHMLKGQSKKIRKTVIVAANTQQTRSDFVSDPQAYVMPTSAIKIDRGADILWHYLVYGPHEPQHNHDARA
uniref:Uncharacterized protein n=1 Tax=Salix viminalis TaxID=40686 RepID=A0A6N2LWV4_SALVM